jgi:hypothetical protein
VLTVSFGLIYNYQAVLKRVDKVQNFSVYSVPQAQLSGTNRRQAVSFYWNVSSVLQQQLQTTILRQLPTLFHAPSLMIDNNQ